MTFQWQEYLDLAIELAGAGDEARARTAVSRAYYSAFCSARNWLSENERSFRMPEPGGTHKFVWDSFDEGHETDKKWIAKEGRKLRASRNSADYDDQLSGIASTAQLSIDRARKILERLRKLRPT